MNWSTPDRVFVLVGSGDGVYGVWKGFRELADRKQISKASRMIGCQAAGSDSAYRAWKRNSGVSEALSSVLR
jgi:threonine synthase